MISKDSEKIVNEYLKDNYVISQNKLALYGILIPIIFSKKIFKKGSEIQSFVKDNFDIELPNYISKSRTLIVGRLVKIINEFSIEEAVTMNRTLNDSLASIIKENDNNANVVNKKKKGNKSLFALWSEHIEESK